MPNETEPTVADRLATSGFPDYGDAFEAAEKVAIATRRGIHVPTMPMLPDDIQGAIEAHAQAAIVPGTVTE